MKKIYFLTLCMIMTVAYQLQAQSFYKNISHTIPGYDQEIFDTIQVAGLSPASLNGSFGLDSVTVKINYSYDQDLQVSLMAPDGTIVMLAAELGGSGDDYNTCFTMQVNSLINMASPPFDGKYRPESWLGNVNNGQNGNGNWILHIKNTTATNNSGTLAKWGLHFDNTPAPPAFFSSSTLPIVTINTDNNDIISFNTKENVDGTMGIIDNGPQLNHITDPHNGYDGNIEIKVRGSSSASFPQHSYTLTTTDADGDDDNDVPILGMPEESKWVLYGAWDDKSLIRNIITYVISNEMGDYAVRTRLCELVLNGDYKGVYVFMEKIKRGNDRVDIHKLASNATSGEDITGGYIFQVDRGYSPGNDCWISNYHPCNDPEQNVAFVYEYPDGDEMNNEQKTYIADYVDSFETALMNGDLSDTLTGYRHFIDAATFVDQSILQELAHNVDAYRLSSFLYKDKNGKLKAGPIWDMNLAYGNADYDNGSAYNTFEWNYPCPYSIPFWWKKFALDTTYMNDYKCRYTTLRQTTLSNSHVDAIIDSLVNALQEPQARHFERWPILGTYLWPNSFVGNTWAEEIDYLKTWIHNRTGWLDEQLYDTACSSGVPPTGTNNIQLGDAIRLFPNPVQDILHIESKTSVIRSVTIYNAVGQQVYSHATHDDNLSLDINDMQLSAGMYNIILTTDKGQVRKKLMIMQ